MGATARKEFTVSAGVRLTRHQSSVYCEKQPRGPRPKEAEFGAVNHP